MLSQHHHFRACNAPGTWQKSSVRGKRRGKFQQTPAEHGCCRGREQATRLPSRSQAAGRTAPPPGCIRLLRRVSSSRSAEQPRTDSSRMANTPRGEVPTGRGRFCALPLTSRVKEAKLLPALAGTRLDNPGGPLQPHVRKAEVKQNKIWVGHPAHLRG